MTDAKAPPVAVMEPRDLWRLALELVREAREELGGQHIDYEHAAAWTKSEQPE